MSLWNKILEIQKSYEIPMECLNPEEFERISNMRSNLLENFLCVYLSLSSNSYVLFKHSIGNFPTPSSLVEKVI
jgi:hypothetical protein